MPAATPTRRLLGRPLRPRELLTALGAIVSAASVLGFVGALHWTLDLLSHFRVQYALTLGLLALLFGFRRRRLPALGFTAFAALNVAMIIPLYVPSAAVPSTSPPPSGPQPRHRGLLVNVNTQQGSPSRVAAALRELDPDFVALLEVSDDWLTDLQPVLSRYPHRLAAPRDDNFGIFLGSKVPLLQPEIIPYGDDELPTLRAGLEYPEGRLTLVATHPLPPVSGEHARLRDRQLEFLATLARQSKAPLLLIGDLNTTPWSHSFRRLLRDSGLVDSARGRGVQPSWPTFLPPLGIPLDHCLHTPDVQLLHRVTGPAVGSDHLPLLFEFTLAPAPAPTPDALSSPSPSR